MRIGDADDVPYAKMNALYRCRELVDLRAACVVADIPAQNLGEDQIRVAGCLIVGVHAQQIYTCRNLLLRAGDVVGIDSLIDVERVAVVLVLDLASDAIRGIADRPRRDSEVRGPVTVNNVIGLREIPREIAVRRRSVEQLRGNRRVVVAAADRRRLLLRQRRPLL